MKMGRPQKKDIIWYFITVLVFLLGFSLPYLARTPPKALVKINSTRLIYSSQESVEFGGWNLLEQTSLARDPIVYVITPTYSRLKNLQVPQLLRIAQSLHLSNHFVHWVIIVDQKTDHELNIQELGHMLMPFNFTFAIYKSMGRKREMYEDSEVKGVNGRITGLHILRANYAHQNGVAFFADDDNTYDSELFHEIRKTKSVTMWPVGCLTKHGLGTPVVDKCGAIQAIYDSWTGGRVFPVDFAGFAVHLRILTSDVNKAQIRPWQSQQESTLLQSMHILFEHIRPLADNCTKILSWHSKELTRSAYKQSKGWR